MSKILKVISIIVIGWVTFEIAILLHFVCSYQMPYIREDLSDELIYMRFDGDMRGKMKEQVKKEIDALFGNPLYSYKEVNKFSNSIQAGECGLFRITIKYGLSLEQYAYVLAHELTHLTKITRSERFCEYNAFVILWENGYKDSARICAIENSYKNETYCATHQINEYIRKEK